MKDIKIIETGNQYGTMNGGSIRLSNITEKDKKMLMEIHKLKTLEGYEITKSDKNVIFKEHREIVGKAYGYDWHKMFMADQNHKKGTYFKLSQDYVEANPTGWTDIPEDILIITKEAPGIVAGHPVADCPVVVMKDVKQGITAVAHCSAELIDKKLPMMMADALLEAYETKDENISVYVSSCAGPDWTYNQYPNWATDKEMWKSGIEVDEAGLFHINLRKVIENQFKERNILPKQVIFNKVDTITNPDYYSNAAASPYGLNQPEKAGRNFVGAFYKDEQEMVKIR